MTDFTFLGKEVLKDGLHYADARSHKAALEIASALNRPASIIAMIEREADKRKSRVVKRLAAITVDAIRNGFDEREGDDGRTS